MTDDAMEERTGIATGWRAVLDNVVPIDRAVSAVSTGGVEVESFRAEVIACADFVEYVERCEFVTLTDLHAGDSNVALSVPIDFDCGAVTRALDFPLSMQLLTAT
jgi:hypothetical protein